jgi:hypothetical protein
MSEPKITKERAKEWLYYWEGWRWGRMLENADKEEEKEAFRYFHKLLREKPRVTKKELCIALSISGEFQDLYIAIVELLHKKGIEIEG